MPPALSRSTSRILRMGNLGPGIPSSSQTSAARCASCDGRNGWHYGWCRRGAAVRFLVVKYPVLKHGSWAAAHLRMVTALKRTLPVWKMICFAAHPPHLRTSKAGSRAITRFSRRTRAMSPVHAHAAAIDIGATLHVAAVNPDCDPEPVRSFGTFAGDLHRIADWLQQCGVRTVAMESRGVYWIPIFEVLEQRGFAVVLV